MGATVDDDGDDTPCPIVGGQTMQLVAAGVPAIADLDADRIGSTRSLWSELQPHMGGYYANIQGDDIEVAGNYGPVYERLVSVKNTHDPMNLFRLNSNIKPTV